MTITFRENDVENLHRYIETWDQICARHKREKKELLQSLSESGYTQTEAARILGRSLTLINNYAQRYGIDWKVKKQGQRTEL